MNIEVVPATLRDISYVGAISTPADKAEVLASGPRSMTEAALIANYMTELVGGVMFCAKIDGNPEYCWGFTRQSELMPWLFSAWAWGSDKLPLVMPAIYRWACTDDNLAKILDGLGCARIEARSAATHVAAHRWLLWLGFERETDLVDWGRDRERFVLFGWVRSNFGGQQDVLRRQRTRNAAIATVTDNRRRRKPAPRAAGKK